MFIQILEGLHKSEAEVLLNMKDKKLNKVYKGLSESVVKEAFGWNDEFYKNRTKIEQNSQKTLIFRAFFIKKVLDFGRGFDILYL